MGVVLVYMYICTYTLQEMMLSKSMVLTKEKNVSDICLIDEPY